MNNMEHAAQLINRISFILFRDAGASENDILASIANYVKGTEKIAKTMRSQAEEYYNLWSSCKDHNFELEAMLQWTKYDLLMKQVREIESQFGIDTSEEE